MTLHTLFTQKNRPNIFWLVFFALILLLISGLYLYLRFGIPSYSHRQLIETLSHPFKESPAQNIIIDLRLPRGIAALLVGASLAVSGAIMQGITRNAIADPGLLGINSGAGLALICGYAFSKSIHYSSILLLSLAGACLASILVFSLSYHPRKGFEQLRLVLSGAMVTTLLTAIGQGLTIYLNLTNAVIGWQAGGLLGTNATNHCSLYPIRPLTGSAIFSPTNHSQPQRNSSQGLRPANNSDNPALSKPCSTVISGSRCPSRKPSPCRTDYSTLCQNHQRQELQKNLATDDASRSAISTDL